MLLGVNLLMSKQARPNVWQASLLLFVFKVCAPFKIAHLDFVLMLSQREYKHLEHFLFNQITFIAYCIYIVKKKLVYYEIHQ